MNPQSAAVAGNRYHKVSDVIIIGAGVAGLAAAQHFYQQAASDKILILEARKRVGGRVWSQQMQSRWVDLGASWLHGTKNNVLVSFCGEHRINTVATNWLNVAAFYDNKRLERDERNALLNSIDDVESLINKHQKKLKSQIKQQKKKEKEEEEEEEEVKDVPISSIIPSIIHSTKDPMKQHFYRHMLKVELTLEYAAPLGELSTLYFDQDEIEGGDRWFPDGYHQILHKLMGLNGGDNEEESVFNILKERVVEEINYEGDGVVIRTKGGETFHSKVVIITVPLGVLKANSITFVPPLPPNKIHTMNNLGVAVLTKVILIFNQQFWGKEEFIHCIDPKAYNDNDSTVDSLSDSPSKLFCSFFHNMAAITGKPILVAFFGPEESKQVIPHLTDTEIGNILLQQLSPLYPQTSSNPLPRNLIECAVARWFDDPFACGSYSFIPVGASGKDYDNMAEPVSSKLFFAGEATHSKFPASVHGAYLSGKREAKRIQNIYKFNNSF